MKLTDELKKDFAENGYALIPNLLNDKHVSKLREKVVYLADYETSQKESYIYPFDKSGKTQRVWNLINKDQVFHDLFEIDFIDEFMNWIFDRKTKHQKYFLSSFQANLIFPGADKQRLHIDTPVPEPLPSWPIKANTIWFLNDFTETNGATEFLPGSHKFSYKPTDVDDRNLTLKKACGPAGSVLVTHGALWHRAGRNDSSNVRIGLLCSFAASYAREIASEEDHSIVVDKDVIKKASPRIKKILGIGHGIKMGALVKPPTPGKL